MIRADQVLAQLRAAGFRTYSGVPCSYLSPLIDELIASRDVRYVPATNEGDAVAVAAGAELAGSGGVALFQNSGLGNAVNPLTSLTHTFRIPILVFTTLRGDPEPTDGKRDEPQHDLMGTITGDLLELMRIPHETFPSRSEDLGAALERARRHMADQGTPYAFVVRKDTIERTSPAPPPPVDVPVAVPGVEASNAPQPRLDVDEVLATLQDALGPESATVTTTGFTGRALYALGDRSNQLYMVGSMGCASSLALGLATTLPARRVCVLDGDGAALMRLGAMATIASQGPPNLVHVLLDNGVHDSTGAQATVSPRIDLCSIARACGYPNAVQVSHCSDLSRQLEAWSGALSFIHVRTLPRADRTLPRPTQTPPEIAARFRAFLQSSADS